MQQAELGWVIQKNIENGEETLKTMPCPTSSRAEAKLKLRFGGALFKGARLKVQG